METKFCRDCGAHRPVADFSSNKRSRDGLAFYCREHLSARSARSREARRVQPRRYRVTPTDVDVPPGFKWCPDCSRVLPFADFPRSRSHASGIATYCLSCHNLRGKQSREKVGGSRTYHLSRRYGISAQEADLMLAAQGGLCAVCRVAPAVHVDHDHATDAVRELLCFNCNGGLGQFRDDPAVLRAAADYVERHRELQRRNRPRPLARRRPEVTVRAGTPPVGSNRRPPVIRRTGLCSRGRAFLAAREADA
ncbi:endonuclease VII domain-containing protein [Modestobacter italicus]|nr:endonuclease VII domain-containing protein [Modestobacter marinus]